MRASFPAVLLTAQVPFLVGATPVTTSSTTIAPTSTANSISSVAPTVTANSTSTSASGPCATVSSLWSAQIVASPAATPIVDASLAYECLNSVALNKTAAIALIDATAPYIEWQSDLAYLKNPPADYYYAPIDVLGTLATVRTKLVGDVYANEYEFQKDLYQVFTPAHDGHFILYPDLLTKAFEWGRQLAIVSISSDGVEVPKIYSYDDVIASPSTAPALVEINGVDAATYIREFAETACFNQDIDACYNTMFFEKAFVAGNIGTGYFSIGGRVRYVYPGANTTFTFDNGTTVTYNNVAHVKGNFAGVVDGPSFYKRFCLPTHTATPVGAGTTSAAAVPIGPTGYPVPVISSNDTIVSGYFLEETGFEDVAVLSMLAMESESPVEFQAVVQEFLADAVAAGKTKLVVDLSGNGGGYILQGYDTFRQLFPQIVQSDYTRFRENQAFLDAAHIFSDAIPANYSPSTASDQTIEFYESFLDWQNDYNLTEQPFASFEDKFAPHIYAGDPYTNIVRWNLNDPLTTSNSSYGFGTDITGYGSRTNFTQPFLAENIVLLLDGYCASTCIIFSEFMIHDAGVKSIAMGGRPNTDPIQGMGGVKGSQSFAWSDIYSDAQSALPLATSEQAAVLNNLTSLPILRSSSSSVNLRDTILPGNLEDGIPAQFVAEYADCRLFYTAPMISDVTKLWEAAATAAWGGGACVAGSLAEKRDVDTSALKRSPWEMKDAERRSTMVRPEKREVTEKDALWSARHGRKVVQ